MRLKRTWLILKGFKKARFANTVGAMTSGTTLDEEEYNQNKIDVQNGGAGATLDEA